jgi:hypothetical protein
MRFFKPFFLGGISAFLILSCAGADIYGEIDPEARSAAYSYALLSPEDEGPQKTVYTTKEAVLFHLDQGVIEHYARFWENSSQDLEIGERLIEDAFTKSVSQEVSSFIINDTSKDYAGEDYEDLYINVFNALNYYHRDDLEDALV